MDGNAECNVAAKNPLAHTLSPGGESLGDSCYDSDTSPTSSRRNSSHFDHDSHSDVSRTTSDTLGTELDRDEKTPTESYSEDIKYSCKFKTRVEFALRLGYTEDQIGSVFDQLGTDIGENDLLSALIQLGTAEMGSPNRSQDESITRKNSLPVNNKPALERKASGGVVKPSLDGPTVDSNLRPIIIDGSNVAMRSVAIARLFSICISTINIYNLLCRTCTRTTQHRHKIKL